MMGYSVGVESNEPKGSIFYIDVKIHQETSKEVAWEISVIFLKNIAIAYIPIWCEEFCIFETYKMNSKMLAACSMISALSAGKL